MNKFMVQLFIFSILFFYFSLKGLYNEPIKAVCVCKGETCTVTSYGVNFEKKEKTILKNEIRLKTEHIRRGKYVTYLKPVFDSPYHCAPFAVDEIEKIEGNFESTTIKYNCVDIVLLIVSLFGVLIFAIIWKFRRNN